jgi:hypothetical protein
MQYAPLPFFTHVFNRDLKSQVNKSTGLTAKDQVCLGNSDYVAKSPNHTQNFYRYNAFISGSNILMQ